MGILKYGWYSATLPLESVPYTNFMFPGEMPSILAFEPIRNRFMAARSLFVPLSEFWMIIVLVLLPSSTGNTFPSSVTRYASSAAAGGTNRSGSDMPPSLPTGSTGGAYCHALNNNTCSNA